MTLKKVVFMGTPDFAVGTLEALIASEYEVTAVFTQPDKPRGRHGAPQMSPVAAAAEKAGIPVYKPRRIREQEAVDILRGLAPDVIVVVAFGQIIPEEILRIPPFGCINVHASLLPAWRGAAPIQWAVISGDRESGVTTMRMDAGLDTGDIILQEKTPIAPDETGGSLFDRLSGMGADLLVRTLRVIEAGEAVYTPQPAQSTTPYAKMLEKESGRIDWTADAEAIERLVRGLSPWPSAWTRLDGKLLKIWRAKALPGSGKTARPGTLRTERGRMFAAAGSGELEILELQLEGKKRMTADAFLLGYDPGSGARLGEEPK